MTLSDELKILKDKIKANPSQYDLDRETGKFSALSSKEVDKYEYFTGDNLRYKPRVIERAKFEYYPLDEVFNKGLKKEDKKEGLLKRLKNIEDQSKEQLNQIECQGEQQLDMIDEHKKTVESN